MRHAKIPQHNTTQACAECGSVERDIPWRWNRLRLRIAKLRRWLRNEIQPTLMIPRLQVELWNLIFFERKKNLPSVFVTQKFGGLENLAGTSRKIWLKLKKLGTLEINQYGKSDTKRLLILLADGGFKNDLVENIGMTLKTTTKRKSFPKHEPLRNFSCSLLL